MRKVRGGGYQQVDGLTVLNCSGSTSKSSGGQKPYPMKPYSRTQSAYVSPVGWSEDPTDPDEIIPMVYPFASQPLCKSLRADYNTQFADLESKAARRFYENSKQLDIQSLVSAAEAPKTFALIGDTAKRLAKGIRSLKRFDVPGFFKAIDLDMGKHARGLARSGRIQRRRGRDPAKFMADSILEVQYGWRPLLGEVEALAQAMAHEWDERAWDITISGAASKTFKARAAKGTNYVDGYEGKIRGSVSYTSRFRVIQNELRTYQMLGLTDLGLVAWELIPYSFVADWFLPVGSWIDAQGALAGLSHVESCRSETFHVNSQGTMHTMLGLYGLKYEASCYGLRDKYQFVRTIEPNPPPAHLILRRTPLDEIFNFSRALSGIALLHNAVRR